MKQLETDRLILRPVHADDLDYFLSLHADPEVCRYLASGRPRTADQTGDWLRRSLAWERETGLSHLVLTLRSDGTRLGRCGLTWLELWQAPDGVEECGWGRGSAPADVVPRHETELGYVLARGHWGQGYASEAARAVVRYAFDEREVEALVAMIHPDNNASERVASGLGFEPCGSIRAWDRTLTRHALARRD